MKIAPSRLSVSALLVPLAACFGLSGFHAEEDPVDAFVHDRTESVLHLSLEAPLGTSIDPGGPPAQIDVYLQRNSWEIWRQPSTGLEEFREVISTPESGASVSLSFSTGFGTLGATTLMTDESGRATTTYSADGGTGGVHLNATAGNSTASLLLVVAYTVGNEETWTYSHTEATLNAALSASSATGQLYSGETRDLTLSVRYDTWDVIMGSNGSMRSENFTSSPAEGASVTWLSLSGDGSVSGYATVDTAGMCHGNLLMGSADTVISADVSYAAGQATSANLYFTAAATGFIGDTGGDAGEDAGSERIFSRSETIASIINLSADGSTELAVNESRTITGEVRQETWDVWVDSYGMEEWRHNYSGPSAWTSVSAFLESGDGNLGSTRLTTDSQGWFSVTYTMGSSPARINFSSNSQSNGAGSPAAVEFSLSTDGGSPETGQGGNTGTLSYQYSAGSYRFDGPHSDGPTYDLTPGTQRTITGVVFWDSWEVWGDHYGNTSIQNQTSATLPSTSLSLSIVQGNGVVSGDKITTDAIGGFSTRFTMGDQPSRVRLQIERGTNAPLASELDFTPPQTGSGTAWVLSRVESSLFVSLSIADPGEWIVPEPSIPLRAQVTETTWEVWEDSHGSSELRNYRTGPAIGALTSFSIRSGSGSLLTLEAMTDAEGVARSEIIPGASDSLVSANASFNTTEASATLTVSAIPWNFQNSEGELELTLEPTGSPTNGISATVHYRTREVWMNPLNGTTEIRHEAEGPAVNAQLSFQTLSSSSSEAASFSPSMVMTDPNGTGSATYSSTNEAWVEVSAQFAGMTVTTPILLPATYNGSVGGGEVDGYGGAAGADLSGGNAGNDGTGSTGGEGSGAGSGSQNQNQKKNQIPVHIRGREHQTRGGGGSPSSEEGDSTVSASDTTTHGEGPSLDPYHDLVNLGPTHSEYEDVVLYARFAATLTRNLLAADGFTVIRTEETRVSGSVDEENDIILPLIQAGWTITDREDLEPYMGYRWFATFAGSMEQGSPRIEATGEAFEVHGRNTPSSEPTVLRTLAGEEDIKALYEQLGTPPNPRVFWKGDVGDMGFGAAPWTPAMRIEEGEYRPENNQSGTPLMPAPDSFAHFTEGVAPNVRWSEYWAQTDTAVSKKDGKATKTLLIEAKRSIRGKMPPIIWFASVTFEILENQKISITPPTVTWLSSTPPTSWIEVDSSGAVRLQPEVERGFKHEIKIVPFTLTAHKRGTIDASGPAISRPSGSTIYEVVMLENADYDESNWQPTSMGDGALDGKQDGKTEFVDKEKDDDFVKLSFLCPMRKFEGSSEVIFDQAGEGERLHDEDIRFYNKDGERILRSSLKISDLTNPSGPLAEAFRPRGLDLFIEIGDLGKTTEFKKNSRSTTRKYADLIWRITVGGIVTEQKVRIYRGGFWCFNRSKNDGTLSLYDGKGKGDDGEIHFGEIVKGPYQVKSGQLGCLDETVVNEGPTPGGWYGMYDKNPDDGTEGMRTYWEKGSRPQINHYLNDKRKPLGFVQQGSYCQWSGPGNRHIEEKGDYGFESGNKLEPYEGIPGSIHFKFELNPIGDFTTRTFLQIHPDGFSDGTFGCVGIQNYNDCCKFLYLARHYFGTRLFVKK